MHDREITFKRLAAGEYLNSETGVRIGRLEGTWWVATPSGAGAMSAGWSTLAAAKIHGEKAAARMRERIAAAYTDAATEDVIRAEHALTSARGVGIVRDDQYLPLANHLGAAYGHTQADDPDRARAWARLVTDAVTCLRAGHQRQADPWIDRVRQYREVTGCGLRVALDTCLFQDWAAARLEDALRADDSAAVAEAFGDMAYLSTEYSRFRQTQSHQTAMDAAGAGLLMTMDLETRTLVGSAYAGQWLHLSAQKLADRATPVVQVGDLDGYAARVDVIRQEWNRGSLMTHVAKRQIVAATGVTWQGATALLVAESTAALA